MRFSTLVILLAVGIAIPATASRRALLLSKKPQAAAASSTAFISAQGSGSDSSQNGLTGFRFTVGASPITVTDLGMYARADDTQPSRLVQIRDSSCNLVIGATVDVSAHDNAYKWTSITPTVLSASTTYHCVFTNATADPFLFNSTPTRTAVATIPQDVWGGTSGSCATLLGAAEKICVGPNFKYQ